jgi:hypothetical protein
MARKFTVIPALRRPTALAVALGVVCLLPSAAAHAGSPR